LDRRCAAALALLALALGASGCGGGGVAKDALLTIYVSAPLHGRQATAGRRMCAGAEGALARHGGRAGDVRLRVVCLDDTGGAPHWRLAAVGADARRATEDSSTIAYIGELEPVATRFSRPIVEAAKIAQVRGPSGTAAMTRVLKAIESAGDTGQLREAVSEGLEGGGQG
jgi:branched-chain amino acid transport system substrate-binding protein